MKRKSKRLFQLLEVMIAMFLVALCILPLIHPHLFMYQEQRKMLRKLQMDHMAPLLYAGVVIQLYKNGIPWQQIKEGQFPLDANVLNGLPYQGYISFDTGKHKPNDEPATGTDYLLKVIIHLKSPQDNQFTDYTYEVFMKRKIKEGQDTEPKKIDDTKSK